MRIPQVGVVVGILIFWILVIRYLIEQSTEHEEGLTFKVQHIVYCLRALTVGITIIVVAVPEGLPLAVTVSLAFSVMKMLAEHSFVKRLQSCELMGSVSVICSDKTGTLTNN